MEYDAIVVGARAAGSATAMLLARGGMRVLLVDRGDPAKDTLSTHALMRGAVLQLERWGLLEEVVAAGTPPVVSTTFHYGPEAQVVEHAPLYAPRRTVLDPLLLRAAREAGATVRLGTDVTALTGTGIEARDGFRATAPLVVGADGARSTLARLADAGVVRQGRSASAVVYGYTPWSGPGYEWFYRPGVSGGIIPTNAGLACVWAGMPPARFAARTGLDTLFASVFTEATGLPAPPVERLRGFPGAPAVLREASGPGWALVGDAGYFKDPLTAHGLTDALRDAELLARSVLDGSPYGPVRDRYSRLLFSAAEEIAGYRWTIPELKGLLLAESAAMKAEVRMLHRLDAPSLAA